MAQAGHIGRPTLLKELNTSMVLSLIKEKESISRADIAKELSLSPPTISKVVENLLADKWIDEVGTGVSSGGRRPLLLQFNATRNYLMGAWLGDTRIITAVSDLRGRVLHRLQEQRAVYSNADSTQTVQALKAQLIRLLEQTMQEADIPSSSLSGIGVAVCGITRREDGTVVRGRYLPGWQDIPIAGMLTEHFSVPVVVDGDTYLAVLGESTAGAGAGVENMVRVTLGAGIGCGMVLGGSVYRGTNGAAGEIGDLIVCDDLGLGALAGRGGYLEDIASYNALVHRGRKALARGEDTVLREMAHGDAAALTSELVLQAAEMGDRVALEIVGVACEALSRAIANIISVLNPQLVLIGGDLGAGGDLLVNSIRQRVTGLLYAPPPIERSTLGRDAEIFGAITLITEHVYPSLRVDYTSSIMNQPERVHISQK